MDSTTSFSCIGLDVWRVVGAHCHSLQRRPLLLTCKSFRALLPVKERLLMPNGEEFIRRELLTTLAARANSFSLFTYFYEGNPIVDIETYLQAARKGNVEILAFLWQRQAFHPYQIIRVCRMAASSNQRCVLDWFFSFLELEPFMANAIAHGALNKDNVDLLNWLECRDADKTRSRLTLDAFPNYDTL